MHVGRGRIFDHYLKCALTIYNKWLKVSHISVEMYFVINAIC